jgi:hypothetical protein
VANAMIVPFPTDPDKYALPSECHAQKRGLLSSLTKTEIDGPQLYMPRPGVVDARVRRCKSRILRAGGRVRWIRDVALIEQRHCQTLRSRPCS